MFRLIIIMPFEVLAVHAQFSGGGPVPGGGGGAPIPGSGGAVPFDGGLSLILLAAGAGVGAKRKKMRNA